MFENAVKEDGWWADKLWTVGEESRRVHNTRTATTTWVSSFLQYSFPFTCQQTQECLEDFPGGPLAKNLPCNAGGAGSIPGQKTEIPHVVEQLSPQAVTTEFECPGATRKPSQCCNKRSHMMHKDHLCWNSDPMQTNKFFFLKCLALTPTRVWWLWTANENKWEIPYLNEWLLAFISIIR